MLGKFIVVEGPDLCGKSTQVPMLVEFLIKHKIPAIRLATPCRGTPTGDILDSHLKGKICMSALSDPALWGIRAPEDALAFQSIMAADKYVASIQILDHLKDGITVVTDRWWQSAAVYGTSDSVNQKLLIDMNRLLPKADLNILFKISAEEFLSRLEKRPEKRDRYDTPEKFDVISGLYFKLWTDLDDGRWTVMDANDSIDNVQSTLRNLISDRFPEFNF